MFGPAGPGPARDQTLVLLQRRHVSLLLYSVVSAAAAVIIIITLTVLFLTVINRKHWCDLLTPRQCQTLSCRLVHEPPAVVCPSACRLLRSSAGSQDELLLLGILLSSSSVLISGLDEASLSRWTFELLCSVSLDGCIFKKINSILLITVHV